MEDRADRAPEFVYLLDEPQILDIVRCISIQDDRDKYTLLAFLNYAEASGAGVLSWSQQMRRLDYSGSSSAQQED
jgi:hypothetical protein